LVNELERDAAAALALSFALTGTAFAGDPSQSGARKVNEYEGQHRAAAEYGIAKASPKLFLAGQDPEYPVTPN
jgi:hypothetical protein